MENEADLPNRLMGKAALAQWKANPLTEAFLAYLDRRRDNLAQAWCRGACLAEADQSEARICGHLLGLTPADVAFVYGIEDWDEEEETAE